MRSYADWSSNNDAPIKFPRSVYKSLVIVYYEWGAWIVDKWPSLYGVDF